MTGDLSRTAKSEFLADLTLVKLDCLVRYTQHRRNFFDGHSLGNQLDDFSLAFRGFSD